MSFRISMCVTMLSLFGLISFCGLLNGQVGSPSAAYLPGDNGSISGHNVNRMNNRPLYCDNSNTFILTGDKPLIRLVQTPFIGGSFLLYFLRDGRPKWVGGFSTITSGYRANKMVWSISDSAYPNLLIRLEVVPLKAAKGMALHVAVSGSAKKDQLVWMYGGIEWKKNGNLSWNLDLAGHKELIKWSFDPLTCQNNRLSINDHHILLRPSAAQVRESGISLTVTALYPASSVVGIRDARTLSRSLPSSSHAGNDNPAAIGTIDLRKSVDDYYWAFTMRHDSASDPQFSDARQAWTEGNAFADQLAKRVRVLTPDRRLNTLASISASVINALWYDSVYVHGAMLWNVPFPGWRCLSGASAYGWHDRMLREAAYYLPSQVLHADKLQASADSALLMTAQDTSSRFYGAGRIARDQKFYNFQSMFFDQLISEWRSTGDTILEKQLRKSLALHLQWEQDCFDPDRDGLYESYINSWPSDSQWYNGGGSAEETSYAYKGHLAMCDMSLRAKDTQAFVYHQHMSQRIKEAFLNKLWIRSKGHSGSYIEQGGYQRLHTDPWLYSIFLPIDMGLVDREMAISSLYYTASVLQNDRMPLGGRQVWTSNWVPGIWSVRERYPGDNYHLSLAYFLTGMAEEGWDIFKGTFSETAFNGLVPGNLGAGSGTDFADCAHMFTRTLVEGLFGYRPDYPKDKVVIAPTFPAEWDSASLTVPDYSIRFTKSSREANYSISLRRPANMDLFLPVVYDTIMHVQVNGQPVKWTMVQGIRSSVIHIDLPSGFNVRVAIFGKNKRVFRDHKLIDRNVGDSLKLDIPEATILSVSDPQGVFKTYTTTAHSLTAVVSANIGNHTFLVRTNRSTSYPELQDYNLRITDRIRDANNAATEVGAIPANAGWDCLDITPAFNGDVRTIYQQKYLSPRPNTVSVRIGTDGYSPWTFPYWKNSPPDIRLDRLSFRKNSADSIITTSQGVPFSWSRKQNNVAFTSLWDNWPDHIGIPVNKKADAIYFLVCGSTNPMQCNIANAVIYLRYSDGSYDSIPLVPPVNYWNISPINALPASPGQPTRNDYISAVDSFCLPKPLPQTVQLGQNCRAILLNRRLKKTAELRSVDLVALSQEIVVGIMGITLMNDRNNNKL